VTRFRCDGIFNDSFIANFQEIVKVKKFVNRSVFDEVIPKILLVRFFPDTVYYCYCQYQYHCQSTTTAFHFCFCLKLLHIRLGSEGSRLLQKSGIERW